ncbi:MAG: hypothetical protein GYA17_11905 [Chloroflexi bacterium]|nr:hypothetical protein [Anaerolineaceae bacterium]NMB89055.1 hypothetical protein [Chloroflexota bacterium]
MRPFTLRLTGSLLIFAALLGAVVSISGLVALWSVQSQVVSSLTSASDLLGRTLTATGDLLNVADATLAQLEGDVDVLEATVSHLAGTIDTTTGVADSIASLVGDDLTGVVRDTQHSLDSVQSSAKLIDDTLRVITAIPFLGTRYQPEVPLETSIAEVSGSLDDMPAALRKVERSLRDASGDAQTMSADIQTLSERVAELKTNLSAARQVIAQYQDILGEAQQGVTTLQANLPGWTRTLAWSFSALLAWLLIAQAGLLTQGLELVSRPRGVAAPSPRDQSAA